MVVRIGGKIKGFQRLTAQFRLTVCGFDEFHPAGLDVEN
jgi:hypothetical protein